MCNSMYAKRPEQANPQRQKMDQWSPGAGGGAWGVTDGAGVSFWVVEKFWNSIEVVAAPH